MRHQSPINVTEPRACRWYMSEPERYMANAKPPTPCNTTLDWYAAILLVLCSMTCSGCCCCWWRRHQDITKSVLPVRLTWVVTVYENLIENIMASSPFGNHLVKTITPSHPHKLLATFQINLSWFISLDCYERATFWISVSTLTLLVERQERHFNHKSLYNQ